MNIFPNKSLTNLKITEQDKTLPIMYLLPKTHKTPVGARFIVVSKKLRY